VSMDGLLWTQDETIVDPATPLMPPGRTPPAGSAPLVQTCSPLLPPMWNCASFGPSGVLYQSGGVRPCTPANDADGKFPFDCRYVMAYDAYSTTGETLHHTGLAGSNDGIAWGARTAPALSPGLAGSWDDRAATMARILADGSGYRMYYSGGGTSSGSCGGGLIPCWSVGSATSSDGITWVKSATNPVSPTEWFNSTSSGANASGRPFSIWFPDPIDDRELLWAQFPFDRAGLAGASNHIRVFLTAVKNTVQWGAHSYGAWSAPVPSGTGPIVYIPWPGPSSPPHTRFWACAVDPEGGYLTGMKFFLDGVQLTQGYGGYLVCSLNGRPGMRVDFWQTLSSGSHTFLVQATDSDGNTGSASVGFWVGS
jgi:hypothetical protein